VTSLTLKSMFTINHKCNTFHRNPLHVFAGMLPLSLVVLKDKIVVLGPGLGFGAQVFVNSPVSLYLFLSSAALHTAQIDIVPVGPTMSYNVLIVLLFSHTFAQLFPPFFFSVFC